ncbi:MAG: AAC(3) family N-acetyltransferase [Verrucomicrobia bacterium]|nr:AAC(3) family N-acetyltransferase [Verrucomicrobiota bacterium]MBU1855853.1 AAC(3) family N-acetyltransferase [Verrucomicrobiota bacterium]
MYKQIAAAIEREINMENLKSLSARINGFERSCCYRDFRRSAGFCRRKLRETGLAGVKQITIPADGKSTFMDCTIPQAWDVEEAYLAIVSPDLPEKDKKLAALRDDVLCVANRCAATPSGGIQAGIVTVEQMRKERDVSGKMVFVRTQFPSEIRREVQDKNGVGIISAYSAGALNLPDNSYWINGWGFPGWYLTKEDKPLVCFSITPRKGAFLEKLLQAGTVHVQLNVKSRAYDGSIYSVTGVVPGSEALEIIVYAHAYEPFVPDDAIGMAAMIEMGRIFKKLIQQKKLAPFRLKVRFLISQELYGFSHYFSLPQNRRNVLCAINMDSICHDYQKIGLPIRTRLSPASMPFFGDYLFREISDYFLEDYPKCVELGNLDNDTFISDRTIGIPSQWIWTHPGAYHHSSYDSFDRMTDWTLGGKVIAAVSTYVAVLASAGRETIRDLRQHASMEAQREILDGMKHLVRDLRERKIPLETAREKLNFIAHWQRERLASFRRFSADSNLAALDGEIAALSAREQKRLADFAKNAIPLPALTSRERLAQNMVIRRKEIGMPFCLARIPYKERLSRPENFEQIFNWLDGKKDFLEALRLFYLESGGKPAEKEISGWLRYLELLARYGYVSITYKKILTKKNIQNGLRKLGIKSGDKVILHSSFLSLGHVQNGPGTVCKALMELVSPQGVVMMPSFNHYGIVEPGARGYYDPKTTPTTNGVVPDTFWKMKNVYRSLDPSHPFTVWGHAAANYVKNHHKVPTMGEGSPLNLLEKAGGKVILIDCPTANTFHHVVEMTNHVACLGERTEEYPVKLPSGKMVKCRTWGWREKACPFIDGQPIYIARMRKLGLLREGRIGQARAIVFKMSDCRRVIEDLFKGHIRGLAGCRTCKIRPRKVPATCASDWDRSKKCVRPDTTAFVD